MLVDLLLLRPYSLVSPDTGSWGIGVKKNKNKSSNFLKENNHRAGAVMVRDYRRGIDIDPINEESSSRSAAWVLSSCRVCRKRDHSSLLGLAICSPTSHI